jgi:hypothetical protein
MLTGLCMPKHYRIAGYAISIIPLVPEQQDKFRVSIEDIIKGSRKETNVETLEAAQMPIFEQLLRRLITERNKHIPRRYRTIIHSNLDVGLQAFLQTQQ